MPSMLVTMGGKENFCCHKILFYFNSLTNNLVSSSHVVETIFHLDFGDKILAASKNTLWLDSTLPDTRCLHRHELFASYYFGFPRKSIC